MRLNRRLQRRVDVRTGANLRAEKEKVAEIKSVFVFVGSRTGWEEGCARLVNKECRGQRGMALLVEV